MLDKLSIKQLLSQPRAEKYSHSLSLSGITIHQYPVSCSRVSGSKSVTLSHNAILHKKKSVHHEAVETHSKKSVALDKGHTDTTPVREGNTIIESTIQLRTRSLNKPAIRQRIAGFLNAQKGKRELYFWTITYPEKTSDTICYKSLNTFLTSVRLQYNDFNYLWVAERQGNGTLHYHIAISRYISVVRANSIMKQAIIYYIRKGLINWSVTQASKYGGVHISKDRVTKKVINFAERNKKKSLSSYLTKYITKNSTVSSHSVWHCSRVFSSLMLRIWVTENEFNLYLKGFLTNNFPTISTDQFLFYVWSEGPPKTVSYILGEINHSIIKHSLYANSSIGLTMDAPPNTH